MARKFKSNTGSPVHVFFPDRPDPVQVPYYAPHLETDDPEVVKALEASPEVSEIVEAKPAAVGKGGKTR